MKSFATRRYRLGRASFEVRLVYTAFLVFVLIGFATTVAFQLFHIGPWPAEIAAHYRGGETARGMSFAKTFRELVEITHFHAFIMGVVYLVLAHLFIATDVTRRWARAVLWLAFFGFAGDLLCPWLIRYGAAAFAWLQIACWAAQWVSIGAFVLFPVREMWLHGARARGARRRRQHTGEHGNEGAGEDTARQTPRE